MNKNDGSVRVPAGPAPAAGATILPFPGRRAAGTGGVPAGLLAAERARSRPAAATEASQPAIDAESVIYRLEEAGMTLLALPEKGYSPRLRSTRLDVVRAAAEAYAAEPGRVRPPIPDATRVDRMDEALSWIGLIPIERHVLRRSVGARALVSPVTERHLFSWRRLGGVMGADHKAVQRWHGEGVGMIVAALNAHTANGAR